MKKLLLALVFIAAAVAWRCLLFADETQYTIVTQFGRPVKTIDAAGLYFKMPYQSALTIDRRLQIYNPRPAEFLTSEKKNVDLDVYVLWRVDDPQRFIETVNDAAGAGARIHDVVWSRLAAAVSRNPLETLVAVDAKGPGLKQLVGDVASDCSGEVRKYGITLIDVQIKRIGLPDQIRDSVFERMRKERARIAQRYRSEGNEEAMKIRATADKQRAVILAAAGADAEITRGKAEAQATRTYSEAHQKDPQFFELTRTLEAYKKILDDKTTILLSGDSDLFKFLSRGPGEPKGVTAKYTNATK